MAMVWDCVHCWVLWLHHIQSLADVTMATKACNLLQGKYDKALLALGIKGLWISFELLGRFPYLVGR
jgi:hypothetical protein